MDAYQILTIIVAFLAAGTGVKGWVDSRRAKRAGMPGDEHDARAVAPAADWLTEHYRAEVEALRTDMRDELAQTRTENSALQSELRHKERELQKAYDTINLMESHIWRGLPPPPPPRK